MIATRARRRQAYAAASCAHHAAARVPTGRAARRHFPILRGHRPPSRCPLHSGSGRRGPPLITTSSEFPPQHILLNAWGVCIVRATIAYNTSGVATNGRIRYAAAIAPESAVGVALLAIPAVALRNMNTTKASCVGMRCATTCRSSCFFSYT